MPDNEDPYKDYYDETFGEKAGTASEILAELDKKAVHADADVVRPPINEMVGKLNTIVVGTFNEQIEKKTRADLIVTIVMAGLAFTAASVYSFVTGKLKVKMSPEEFMSSFHEMLDKAIKAINPHDGKGG